MPRWRAELTCAGAALLTVATLLPAQTPPPQPRASGRGPNLAVLMLIEPGPAPGQEAEWNVGSSFRALGWRIDALGNYSVSRGSGAPRRVVACALDRAAFVVSEITDDGFLRLHDPADPRRHPLWAQFHEGQRVTVATADGLGVPGVVGVRSTHLWRRRAAQESPATIDELWVDVGARSRAEAARIGVRMLAPVTREVIPWAFGADTALAAPAMAGRAACAAVVAAAHRGPPRTGTTTYVLAAQSAFDYTGLRAALARLGATDTLVLVDADLATGGGEEGQQPPTEAVRVRAARLRGALPHAAGAPAVIAVGVRTTFGGTLVESITTADVNALARRVAALAGVEPGARLRGDAMTSDDYREGNDSAAATADLLRRLADLYGVAGHEARVRDAVRAELPASLRTRATVDTAGNLVLAIGPDRDTTVFVAHLDEIGYEVTSIARDGTVSLAPRGGFFASLWEGQPALLHLDAEGAATGCALPRYDGPDRLRGIFVPRSTATKKQPDAQTAWFGTDSAGLVACGVRVGMAVTGVKRAQRLAGTRFTARSIDDRVGCTALLLALRSIDPAKLTHKVIFVWSVREETGLDGASALAASLGPSVHRVHAVDTFVSSDSPLESHRFAYTPIGKGAVVRALDNSSATPRAEVDRVVSIARRAGIPLQVGTTNGGNDGSMLARYGAVDVPLSWPARYSHSPVETIDLKDVDALARLIAALATQ